MALPHFNMMAGTLPELLYRNLFEIRFYSSTGKELEGIKVSSLNISESEDSKSIVVNMFSDTEHIPDYKHVSEINYLLFTLFSKNGDKVQEILHNVFLTDMKTSFAYDTMDSFLMSECQFIITGKHDLTNKDIEADDAIKCIIRGVKINDLLK